MGQAQHESPFIKPAPVAVTILNRQQTNRIYTDVNGNNLFDFGECA
jgi:hypothetical protein